MKSSKLEGFLVIGVERYSMIMNDCESINELALKDLSQVERGLMEILNLHSNRREQRFKIIVETNKKERKSYMTPTPTPLAPIKRKFAPTIFTCVFSRNDSSNCPFSGVIFFY